MHNLNCRRQCYSNSHRRRKRQARCWPLDHCHRPSRDFPLLASSPILISIKMFSCLSLFSLEFTLLFLSKCLNSFKLNYSLFSPSVLLSKCLLLSIYVYVFLSQPSCVCLQGPECDSSCSSKLTWCVRANLKLKLTHLSLSLSLSLSFLPSLYLSYTRP